MKATKNRLFNPKNERIKYLYRVHCMRAKGKDFKTVQSYLKNIRYYEEFFKFECFSCFNLEKAHKYIDFSCENGWSLSFIHSNLRDVAEFLRWCERQRGYRSKINPNHIDYLNLTNKQKRQAKATKYPKSYKFDQIIEALRLMPHKSLIQKRNRAMVALQALCTMRISELRTIKLENVIQEDGGWLVHISPRNMSVKFSKERVVYLLPLPDDVKAMFLDWVDELKALGFKGSDPVFPVFASSFNQMSLNEQTITHNEIKSDTVIRDVFKRAFIEAGFEYINPHSFRKTIALYAQDKPPAFFNAVRQNLGHNSIDTTLSSYGQLSRKDQGNYINSVTIAHANELRSSQRGGIA